MKFSETSRRTWPLLLLSVLSPGIVAGRHMIDMTHTLDENAPKWPLASLVGNVTYFGMQTLVEDWVGDVWASIKRVEFYEHLGTHMDAPIHLGARRWTIDEIPVDKFMGPGVKIDIRDKAARDPNYAVTVDDILAYEVEHGRIPNNAIVLMSSGWAEYYDKPSLVFGTDDPTNASSFHFPGWSLDACKFLLSKRQVNIVGVDTPSVDPGNVHELLCHRYLQPYNVPLLEYVANLEPMPPAGSTIFLGPMKHRGGSGGPTRVICIVDNDNDTSGASRILLDSVVVVLAVTATLILYCFRL